ncbi:hypothetical protein [Pseudolabrys sp. FHR47]|uniref:hypothetical protein n=1 Tax=Pseudolabrys sp. FHR47 TaxID=2562284 RepID=UPI0010BEF534|nr:hypothetical protein [Pseudolabrys sp. FHR47]
MAASASRLRVFFLHLPKAGGTAIATRFKTAFESANSASTDTSLPTDPKLWKEWSKYDFIHGHCGFGLFKSVGQDYSLVTNFRHPVDRVVSLYDFWRNNIGPEDTIDDDMKRDNPPSTTLAPYLARQLSFSEFIRRQETAISIYIRNWHARQLLGDPWEYRKLYIWDMWLVRFRFSRLYWFYVCEEPEKSETWFRDRFPSLEHKALALENPTDYSEKSRTTPSSDDIQVILRDNWADVELYERALKILKKRVDTLERR